MKKLQLSFILILILGVFSIFSVLAINQKVPPDIEKAFRMGDAALLAKFFNNSIDLVILENEDVYSKNQAELLIKDFFRKNKPSNFVILHEGEQADASYAIGRLTTDNNTKFRIYFLMKNFNGVSLITQLKIESNY